MAYHGPAVNTVAIVTLTAVTDKRRELHGIAWSYNASPTGGSVIIEDGSTTIFKVFVAATGPDSLNFNRTIFSTPGQALTITLAAAGGAVTGTLNVW